MCDTYNCDYLNHNTFRFNLIVFQLNTDFPSQFCGEIQDDSYLLPNLYYDVMSCAPKNYSWILPDGYLICYI